ncbi:ribose transport system ATP-binding protein [Georgenia satyanarayanai]|uniref:Ribose transport system ATP-binding protein n=1 Tax=Georgenia satyanarayanai TaxID=860221 RepID=A0A2Y9A7P3_9MICO|nr:sugar ABC transporter ATP-binding protein [Georgenia satyanarayanai]PYG00597.1 ribose transport system ATP-binding protein [Georgenia satyanarayanai]SSA39986.1 ribose transport system ATP-binding protein [Georgenia satyanarayanai]
MPSSPLQTVDVSAAASVLEVTGVTKQFAGIKALTDVSFSVAPGSIHALVGENGAGKSTLIKVLTGVYQPDAGEIRYRGEPVSFSRPSDAQDVGISTVYQEISLVPLLSVARNVFLGREPRNRLGLIDVRAMNRDAQRITADLGIEVDVTQDVGRLGLGVQQMIALARAMTINARTVIMDEPTSSLEIREVETLFSVARRLRDDGVGIVFVSHRLDELWQLCDAITILRDGEVVHRGQMADLDRRELVSHMLGREIAEGVRERESASISTGDADAAAPVLSVRGLRAHRRLHGIDLDVRPGEIVGLAGLLGSGRSETVKAIYGDLASDADTIDVEGTAIRRNSIPAALDAGIALLSEDRKAEGIIPDLSVRDNIVLAVLDQVSRWGVISDAKVDELVDTFIKRLRIKVSSPQQLVSELSGGNQQKVLIARWLCTKPKVFLLDEPTRGIDVGAKQEVASVIDELAEKGLAVLMISSETEELVDTSDKVVVLHEGSVNDRLSGSDLTHSRLLAALVAPTIHDLQDEVAS